jgi:hypothetical protein
VSLSKLTNELMPKGCHHRIIKLRSYLAQLIQTHSGRTPRHQDVRFAEFFNLFIRFSEVETPGIVRGISDVTPDDLPDSHDHKSSFFNGFLSHVDKQQAIALLRSSDRFNWVIIQGKSIANEFVVLKKMIKGEIEYSCTNSTYI